MSSADQARAHYLPLFRLTKVQDNTGKGHIPVDHHHGGIHIKYWRAPVSPTATRWTEFRAYPLVVDGSGVPWAEACLWLLDKAQAKPQSIHSLGPVAQDLAAYRTFLDALALQWDDFSAVEKYVRPTYLYRNHLHSQVNAGELKKSTASRRMSTVISFYRFLMRTSRMQFSPANPPWDDRDVYIEYRDTKGFKQIAAVKTTDISIKESKRQDPMAETIDDGGKLRPLSVAEQKALVFALKELGNSEYSLMHYTALLTGAREMTVLTLRVRDVLRPSSKIPQWPHKIRCGPGTGIDTKGDVFGVYLSVPRMLYELLHDYAVSERAMHRRAKTTRGEDPYNYLFLTQRGQPYYESKEDRNAVRDSATPLRRSALSGRPLRKFIEESVIPLVQKKIPKFKYRYHDLRATFGMNWVDYQMLQAGPDFGKRFVWARDQLKKLMWHKSPLTTDKYLEHREHLRQLQLAQQGWSDHLVELIQEPT
ncbi:site-specific integrase [Paenacidovorax caeni]|nr:site-specific integrase [Paenacidovorax caeni]